MPQKLTEKYLNEEEIALVHRARPLKQLVLFFFLAFWVAGASASIYGAKNFGVLAWLLWITGLLASSVAINAAFLIMHEGTHSLLSRNPVLNRWLGFISGLPLFFSFSAYQFLHIRHHDFLGKEDDPDDYNNYTGHPLKVWGLHWLRLFLAGYLYLLLVPILAWRKSSNQVRSRIAFEYILLILFYSLVFYFMPIRFLIQSWLLPIVIVNFMVNARGLTQHSLADVSDPLLASRSIRTNPIIAFLYMNENYHLEHHLFPGVPFYSLPHLHSLLKSRLPRVLVVPSYSWFVFAFVRASFKGDNRPLGMIKGHEAKSDK